MLPDDLRQLPYLVHTNRELGLMLRGTKPLAMFMDGARHFPDCVERYLRMFDRHVATGRFAKRVQVIPNSVERLAITEWHRIFYALPGEQWRIDAMIELRDRPGDWSEAREREEGRLLGYTEEQNDIWLARSSRLSR
jgi:hypothetical protein